MKSSKMDNSGTTELYKAWMIGISIRCQNPDLSFFFFNYIFYTNLPESVLLNTWDGSADLFTNAFRFQFCGNIPYIICCYIKPFPWLTAFLSLKQQSITLATPRSWVQVPVKFIHWMQCKSLWICKLCHSCILYRLYWSVYLLTSAWTSRSCSSSTSRAWRGVPEWRTCSCSGRAAPGTPSAWRPISPPPLLWRNKESQTCAASACTPFLKGLHIVCHLCAHWKCLNCSACNAGTEVGQIHRWRTVSTDTHHTHFY